MGIGFGREEGEWRKSGLGFDQWKYKMADVPISEKYNLQIERDYEAEKALKEKLELEDFCDGYVVTHSESSFAKHDFNIPTAIEVKEIPAQMFQQIIYHLLWDYYVGIIIFWLNDRSDQFSDTSMMIDKTMDLFCSILKAGAVNKMFDIMSYFFI